MITPGSVLIEKDTLRPQYFQLEDESSTNTWMSVKHNFTPHALEQELSATGWTFFYIANSIKSSSFGFNREKMIQAALKRIITRVKAQNCNCLEIDDVVTHSFLRMPYVSVSAHPRHIQKGMVFSGRSREPEQGEPASRGQA